MKLTSIKQYFVTLILSSLLVFLSPAVSWAEEYLLQPGDVLSFKIIGPAELEQDVPIEMNGTAWFPIIGEVQAADSTLKQLREQVANAYSVTSFPVTSGAENVPQLILSSQVYISISSYKPIYIAGDLPQPLVLDFQPGMTLQTAVILANAGAANDNPGITVLEQEEAVLLNLARANARIWRLKTLLGTATPQDYDNILVADTPDIRQIIELEKELIAARTEDFDRQGRTIASNIQRARMRLAALSKLKANEEKGLVLDEQIVDGQLQLEAKGLAVVTRLIEARRSAISSAGSIMRLVATIEEVQTELDFLQDESESIQISARSQAWEELADAIGDAQDRRAELATLRAARAAVSLSRTRIVAVITRRGEVLPPVDIATTDEELYPGDLVEIIYSLSGDTQSPRSEEAKIPVTERVSKNE